MNKIRVGGVPEHFNLPWHLAMENKLFHNQGIEIEWKEYKGGTGAMTAALREDEVDVCIVLTEGIIADIIQGNPSKLIGIYLNTPLIWGVFTGANNPMNHYGEIYEKKYAISRLGSGSHLMPQVDAYAKGYQIKQEQFKIIKNLDGALESLSKNETDVFYWEKYTTKPFVDKGLLKHLGDYVTPWPCFVIAASQKYIDAHSDVLSKMLDVIYFTNKQFMQSLNAIEEVAKRYEQQVEDVENWFYSTEWSTNKVISDKVISNVIHTLIKSNIIEKGMDKKQIVELI